MQGIYAMIIAINSQSQVAATNHFSIEQLLPFVLQNRIICNARTSLERKDKITALKHNTPSMQTYNSAHDLIDCVTEPTHHAETSD